MDTAKLEQLRTDLLNGDISKHRRLLMVAGLLMVAFWIATITVGYYAVKNYSTDDRVNVQHGVNTPSRLDSLTSARQPADLVNSIVYLNRVKLEPSDASNVYFASDSEGHRMLVVSQAPHAPKQDSVVNLLGTVRPVSNDLLKKWKLDKEQQKTIKAQGLYLEAESIKTKATPSATVAKK
jgi:hypothetical protein